MLGLRDVAVTGDFFAEPLIPALQGRFSSFFQYFSGTNRRFAIEATSS